MKALPTTSLGLVVTVLLLAGAGPAPRGGVVTIETVVVGVAGNAADAGGLGSVARRFGIGRFEVSNDQYVAFLNAVAADDPNGLYETLMTDSDRGGVQRFGAPGSFLYLAKPNFGNKPVGAITWTSAARFCNWLHNGQPGGPQGPTTTEDGAYDLSLPIDQIVRRPAATWFIPTHDEWYKAAYHEPFDPAADAGGTPDYYFYTTRSDTAPVQATADAVGNVTNPGQNVANHAGGADWNGENGNVTTVGGCSSLSGWGAFDMGGNINEWTETLGNPIPPDPPGQPDPLPTRTIRGGDFSNPAALLASPESLAPDLNMVAAGINIGFRVAGFIRIDADIDGNGFVQVDDLLTVLAEWGDCPAPCPPLCDGDINDDCRVDVDDLLAVLGGWS